MKAVANYFDWKVRVCYDETLEKYFIENRSQIIFVGDKKECKDFISRYTIPSMVDAQVLD